MTRESFEIYFRHLREGGVIAVTSHNDYYDASSLLRGMADLFGAKVACIPTVKTADCDSSLGFALISRSDAVFESEPIKSRISPWPDGGTTPFAGAKGTVMEGGFRAPAIIRWPGKVTASTIQNGIFSGLDWLPTLVSAAGYQGDIAGDLRAGKQLGGTTYKVYLDGYNQMNLLTGKGPSARHEIWYFAETTLGVRGDCD